MIGQLLALFLLGLILGAGLCFVIVPMIHREREARRERELSKDPEKPTELSVARVAALHESNLLRHEICFGDADTVRYHSTRLYVETQRLAALTERK